MAATSGTISAKNGKSPARDPAGAEPPLSAEIASRFGMLPNFFRLAPDNPEITAHLWGFARFAYLDNPLPSLFKERLFVYLSRFCEVRYCIIRHVGFLTGCGRPAGDSRAPAQTVGEALDLVRWPLPRDTTADVYIKRCSDCTSPLPELPPPGSEMELALIACAAHVFLQSAEAQPALAALERALGKRRFEYLVVFLAFVRTAHYWTRLHRDLRLEGDVEQLMATQQTLAECLLNDPEARSCDMSRQLLDELDTLREEQRQNAGLSQAYAAAREIEERLRRSNAELAAHVADAEDARGAALKVMEEAIQAKQDLWASEQKLKEADRRKDEFLATLAHELRNPLAPIASSVQIMRLPGVDSEVIEEARRTIERQVTHMVRLVDDLLDISRISRAKFELRKQRVALSVVLQTAVETSKPVIEAQRQTLAVVMPPQVVWLNADLTRLAQAVANLLNNASKYSPEGTGIELAAEADRAEVVIRVSDRGIGIPAETLPHIFEMFRQGDATEERGRGGLGIGLTLVKSLVEMHAGTVEAKSAGAGHGSEFILRLPVVTEAPEAPEPVPGNVPASAARRVLVVDDNRDAAASLAMLLSHSGHHARQAHDGIAAIEEAENFRPDAVMLDIGMPKLDGYEVARRIRQQPWGKEVLLVALTGWGQEEDRARSKEAGIDCHFVKPVEYSELLGLLGESSLIS